MSISPQQSHLAEISSRALYVQLCPCKRVGITAGTRARLEKFSIAIGNFRGYRSPVAVNSAIRVWKPGKHEEHKLHLSARSFFSPAFYGGAVREDFGPVGFLLPRSSTLVQRYRLSCGSETGSSSAKGASPMTTLIPSKIRAIAHRRMALSALRANSSLSVRLKRYNDHMSQARALEAVGDAV